MKNAEIISALKNVNEFVIDSIRSYKKAAEHTTDEYMKNAFIRYSGVRESFSESLRERISTHGGEPVTRGTVRGRLLEQWLKLKVTLETEDDKDYISALKTSEEWLQKACDHALEKDLPKADRELLHRQREISQKIYEELQELEQIMFYKTGEF